MSQQLSPKALQLIEKMQQSELTESVIYEKIAKHAKGDENKETLRRLSREEQAHYEIWHKYTGKSMSPRRARFSGTA